MTGGLADAVDIRMLSTLLRKNCPKSSAESLSVACCRGGCSNLLTVCHRTYKATKPGLALSDVYLSMFYCIVLYCCLLGPLLLHIISFRCYVFCLLVVLVELSVPAK